MGRVSTSKQNTYGQQPVIPKIPKVQIPRGGRSAIKAEERRRNRENAKTPYVPPAPTSPASERPGGRARVSGGIQIGVPKGAGISTQRPNRSSSTKTETPTQNPVSPSQPTGGKIYGALPPSVNRNLGAYDSSVTLPGMTGKLPDDYKETEQTAGQTAETYRPGAGFGSEQRIDSRGNIQTGTNTSPKPMTMDDANKLLTGGYKMNQQYASNQLPYTQSSPYAGKGNAEIYNQETLLQHQQGPGSPDYVSLSKDIFGDRSGVANYERGKNMNVDYNQMDVNPAQKVPEEVTNWANRTMADNSDAKLARRRAFLDGASGKKGDEGFVGSMQALRRTEALQNMTYAGGKHYIGEGNGSDKLIEVGDKQDVGRYKMSQEGAREIRDKYVNALTPKDDSVEYQTDAPAMLPDAVPHNTSIDKSPFDTSELLGGTQSPPNMESIIDDDKPYVGMQKYNPFR